jgi:acyl-CoA synthetase (AMP-forming)/AMP-acid ligase II
MDHPDIAHRDLSSLRAITHAGASAPPTLRRRARERLGAVLAHVYGASETGIVSALSPAKHDLARPNPFSCAGGIHPGVDVRFRRNDGTLADPGETGSIQMRFPAMAGGYRTPGICTQTCGPPGQARKGATEPTELCPPSRPDPDTNAKTIRSWPASAIRRGCACEGHG